MSFNTAAPPESMEYRQYDSTANNNATVDENEKPVFFFDIDNCVGIHLPMYESKTTNYIVALSKEFETLYIIT